ncbi:hypothetical protein K457DRAFT_618880 [Linnemannia elongata AG-77]|uniref:Uncharacterized protein n=1 Tax=Linnemannia elongata AG-77 TaxID=1314771 RepID=A0A197JTB7_9FUNG|nr:hypothetical protein K457DRAFT_618880 [Linnemannia elongata AG-77]
MPARVLIDGGAEGDVVSSSFCRSNNEIGLQDSVPIPVLLPNSTASFAHHTAFIRPHCDNLPRQPRPIVYPLRKYDLILGKPWLTEVNPMINWRTNEVVFTTSDNQTVHWNLPWFPRTKHNFPHVLISALNFTTLAHDSPNTIFMA